MKKLQAISQWKCSCNACKLQVAILWRNSEVIEVVAVNIQEIAGSMIVRTDFPIVNIGQIMSN